MRSLYGSTGLRQQPQPAPDPWRDRLLDEAVYGTGLVRLAARCALRGLADAGLDPRESPLVGCDELMPQFGSLGMAMTSFPACLFAAPYEEQGARLLRRLDELRARAPADDRSWSDAIDAAAEQLWAYGVIPADPALLDGALVLAEIQTHLARAGGVDVRAELAAFDEAERAAGCERDQAVRALGELLTMRGRERGPR